MLVATNVPKKDIPGQGLRFANSFKYTFSVTKAWWPWRR